MKNKIFYTCLVIAGIVILTSSTRGHKIVDPRWDNCVEEMNQAIPDPNDDGRASFLKNCYEVKTNVSK